MGLTTSQPNRVLFQLVVDFICNSKDGEFNTKGLREYMAVIGEKERYSNVLTLITMLKKLDFIYEVSRPVHGCINYRRSKEGNKFREIDLKLIIK